MISSSRLAVLLRIAVKVQVRFGQRRRQGSFKWDSTYQVDYPHYMTLQAKLQHAGHSNTNVCTGYYLCRHKHLSNHWQFFLSGWLSQPILSQSSSISCSVDILWITFPMFISLLVCTKIHSLVQGPCKWDRTIQFDFPYYMTLQTKLQQAASMQAELVSKF